MTARNRRPPKVTASFRIEAELKEQFEATADERGENPSEEIRKFIQRYVRRTK